MEDEEKEYRWETGYEKVRKTFIKTHRCLKLTFYLPQFTIIILFVIILWILIRFTIVDLFNYFAFRKLCKICKVLSYSGIF